MRSAVSRILALIALVSALIFGVNMVICRFQLNTGCTLERLDNFRFYTFLSVIVLFICYGVSLMTQQEVGNG